MTKPEGTRSGAEEVAGGERPPWLRDLITLLEGLRYGSVTLVVQDGKVIQMERNEKVRFS